MKEPIKSSPPKWAERFLTWYCRAEMLEDLQGDLNEYFFRNVKEKGLRRAKLIYIIDVIKFLRPYTIRKPEFLNLFIQWIMIGSYIKTSGRTIVRNKLFSTINIIGLAISMSVGLMMISVVSDVLSYDKFHVNHKRIYRVTSRYQFLEEKDHNPVATSSLKAARIIEESFTGPEDVAILRRDFSGDVKAGEKIIPLSGYWANASLFNVFTFQLLAGNASTVLKEPFSVVLTETAAKKLYGSEEAIGKVVMMNEKEYTITGIMADVPAFSQMHFEMLGSLSTRNIIVNSDNKNEMAWDNVWNTWTYLLLPPNTNLKDIQDQLDRLSIREDPSVKNTHIELALQPMDEIMLGKDLGNQIGPTVGSSMLWIFGGLAFIVILSACFNYTNLSIARSLKRTREVGIRKVIGALKSHVLGQFVVEAVIISLCALALALVLFFLVRPYFLSITPDLQKLFRLELSPIVLLWFIAMAIVVGIVAGFFPALFFSRINAVQVLKDLAVVRGFKKLTMRKVLIVFQYIISIIFITSTFIIYKQFKHFVAFDLGYKTENILNISMQGNKAETFKKILNELPEVSGISQSAMVTSVGSYWGTRMKYYANPDDSAGVNYNMIDENYIPLHEHKLLAGRNFTAKGDSIVENEVIVNQQVLKRFNIAEQNPAKAINEVVRIDRKDMQIIGVMKDFQYGRANDSNSRIEVVFRYSKKEASVLNVKLKSTDVVDTYSKIETLWKGYDPIHPFKAKFYDDEIDASFPELKAFAKMAGFMAFLAICIASMGLLGMVVFTTETRLKEISIRKVLGASEAGLMILMGRGFFLLMAIAAAIALPTTYLIFERLILPELTNHAPIATGDLLTGVLGILLVAILMIGTQTRKVSRANPAEVLKSE